jgi:hypothetical protein
VEILAAEGDAGLGMPSQITMASKTSVTLICRLSSGPPRQAYQLSLQPEGIANTARGRFAGLIAMA